MDQGVAKEAKEWVGKAIVHSMWAGSVPADGDID